MARYASGHTQATLAAACDMSEKQVQRLETGVALPSLPTARRLARALSCDIETIFPDPDAAKGTP